MSASLATVSYIAAIILFILSLGGLSNPETSRRGNLYGMIAGNGGLKAGTPRRSTVAVDQAGGHQRPLVGTGT